MTGKQNGLTDKELNKAIWEQSNARKSNLTIIKYVWENSSLNLYDSKELVYKTLAGNNEKPKQGAKVVKLSTTKD